MTRQITPRQMVIGGLIGLALLAGEGRANAMTSDDIRSGENLDACLAAVKSPTPEAIEDLKRRKLVKAEHQLAISQHEIVLGMTRCEVFLSWGDGWNDKFMSIDEHFFEHDHWERSDGVQTLYFDNDILYRYDTE